VPRTSGEEEAAAARDAGDDDERNARDATSPIAPQRPHIFLSVRAAKYRPKKNQEKTADLPKSNHGIEENAPRKLPKNKAASRHDDVPNTHSHSAHTSPEPSRSNQKKSKMGYSMHAGQALEETPQRRGALNQHGVKGWYDFFAPQVRKPLLSFCCGCCCCLLSLPIQTSNTPRPCLSTPHLAPRRHRSHTARAHTHALRNHARSRTPALSHSRVSRRLPSNPSSYSASRSQWTARATATIRRLA
jgi:hypothetical protein